MFEVSIGYDAWQKRDLLAKRYVHVWQTASTRKCGSKTRSVHSWQCPLQSFAIISALYDAHHDGSGEVSATLSALAAMASRSVAFSDMLRALLARAHSNTVVVALAAKIARTVWALLRYSTRFEPRAIAIYPLTVRAFR
jgi:hypothetical protein